MMRRSSTRRDVRERSSAGLLACGLAATVLVSAACSDINSTLPSRPGGVAPVLPTMAVAAYDAEYPITGRTYHVAPTGNDAGEGTEAAPFATIQRAADVVDPGDGVIVHAGSYRGRVFIRRGGTEGAYVVFRGEGEVIVEGPSDLQPTWPWDGAFNIEDTGYVVVSGFYVDSSHYFGFFAGHSHHVVFQNNRTYNTPSSGICVWESRNAIVRGNSIRAACTLTAEEAKKANGMAAEEFLAMASVTDFDVYHNEVYEGTIPWHESSGGEGIDVVVSSARGRVHDNFVHDLVRLGMYVDSWDGQLTDIDVYANEVWNCQHSGFAVSSEAGGTARNVRMFNNLSHHNGDYGFIVSTWGFDGPRENVSIFNNTVYANGGPGDWGGGILVQSRNVRNIVIRNNVVFRNVAWQLATVDAKNVVAEYNLVSPVLGYSWTHEFRGLHALEADPLFVAPATRDYHLQEGSPAIDSGSAVDAPGTDFDGVARPQGRGFDRGAFEKQ